MCEYCKEKDGEINSPYFELNHTAGFSHDRIYASWIIKGKEDKEAGIMITTDNTNGVYFNINYCPMCGRKLREENK